MKDILHMEKKELLKLTIQDVPRLLTPEEVVHIARKLGAYWTYDYEAAKKGQVGLHAELKSGLHSDGFFVSKILLEPENVLDIIAHQMVMRVQEAWFLKPDYISGIPEGAKKLGSKVAKIFGVPEAVMEKDEDRRIRLKTEIPPQATLLFVEDFCTRGTGFREAVAEVAAKQPSVQFAPYELVILNRGGLKEIIVAGVGSFAILPVVEHRVQDWEPGSSTCPLCALGSTSRKPKESEENWRLLTTSQL